jgi:hypothetical protein
MQIKFLGFNVSATFRDSGKSISLNNFPFAYSDPMNSIFDSDLKFIQRCGSNE